MPLNTCLERYPIGADFAPGPLLTSISDLQQSGVSSETVLRVAGASVVYANYTLLQHDFPQLRGDVLEETYPEINALAGKARQLAVHEKIDNWLLENTTFISERQAGQAVVNTPIPTGQETRLAYRPPFYGRALVFLVENSENERSAEAQAGSAPRNRLLDVKGIGVAPGVEPRDEIHRTGLMTVGEMLYELIIQQLLQRIFRHSKTALQTLPVYGIIDLGFNEVWDGIISKPAGLMVRRAHRRPENSGGLYPYNSTGQRVQLEIELLLRKYGITSTDSGTTVKTWKENGLFQIKYGRDLITRFDESRRAEIERVSHFKDGDGERYFDGINIQHTREISVDSLQATLVDFQAYRINETFSNPILSLVCDKLLLWGGTIWPDYESFVRPNPVLQISTAVIGETISSLGYLNEPGDAYKKINSLCYGLANDIRQRKITSEVLKQKLQVYLDTITNHLIE